MKSLLELLMLVLIVLAFTGEPTGIDIARGFLDKAAKDSGAVVVPSATPFTDRP